MKKFDAIMMKVFLYELPVLVLFILTCMIMPLEKMAQGNFYVNLWYQFGGFYIFGSWLFTAFYISMKLLLAPDFRQLVLAKLTFMRERDEREVGLTGQAAKNTMLTTLAALIFLFGLSCVQFSYARVPAEFAAPGNSKVMSWGIGFSLSSHENETSLNQEQPLDKVIEYNGLPLSTSAILLGLIGWHIFSYNHYMRKYE